MKQSEKPTADVLVKADTNSEWDNCEFAIIHLSEAWKETQAERLGWVTPLQGKPHFCSMNFYDAAVEFYGGGEEDHPDMEAFLAGKEWMFVELDTEEQETFAIPESRLDCYRLVLHPNGTACYTAYGKHTGEEFWTGDFDLNILCTPIAENLKAEQ